MDIFAFIFARGGSQGVPGKNIRSLNGKPLIAHSIDSAKEVSRISKIFVSTDFKDIADVAKEYGAEVIPRPAELSQSDTPEWLAWRHALDWLKQHNVNCDVFVSLPATAPLRSKEDIESCLDSLDNETDMVITMTNANRNPWFNMLKKENGYVDVLLKPDHMISRRQDAPVCYDMTTVAYVTRPSYVLNANSHFEGKVKGVLVPAERAIDIDTELDFKIAETLFGLK